MTAVFAFAFFAWAWFCWKRSMVAALDGRTTAENWWVVAAIAGLAPTIATLFYLRTG